MKKVLFAIVIFITLSLNCFAKSNGGDIPECEYRYRYSVNFIKQYEGNENTSDAEFKFYNLDKSISINIGNRDNDYNYFVTNTFDEEERTNFLKFITSDQKELLNNIKDFENLRSYYESGNYTYNYENRNSYLESIRNSNGIIIENFNEIDHNANIIINTFGILEETKSPIGYEKEKYIVPVIIRMKYSRDFGVSFYSFRPVGYIVYSDCSMYTNSYILKYSNSINYYNFYDAISNMDDSYIIGNSCKVDFTIGNIYGYEQNVQDYPKDNSCQNIIINKKGTPNIIATGTLNNEENITIDEETPVSYKLVVKNDSNTPSSNNVIKSIIPKKVEYVRGSASHNGVYNEEENSITWNIDLIDTDEEITLTYEVKVPSNTSTHYDFTTSIKSDEVEEINEVKNTVTTTRIDNPKTGDITQYIIVILLGISMVAYLIILNKKKTIESL